MFKRIFYENKNVLVTGGTGFVGINLINKLLELGANVTATLYKTPPVIKDEKIRYIPADLTKKEDCQRACKGQELVFMCAANTSGAAVMEKTPLVHVTPNVVMNTLMLEAAYEAKVKKFLFLSSTTVYPPSNFALKETDVDGRFFDKYFCVANMKLFSEKLCEMYANVNNPMTTIVVRPGNLYGDYDDFEWDTSHSTAALIRRVIERHDPLVVWGDGSDIKDIMYISDFIDGILAVMYKIEGFDIFNIASGASNSIKDTLETILRVDGYTDANIVYDKTKPTMIPKRLIDIRKAYREIGFSSNTSLDKGIRKTIEWYKENYKNDIKQ